MEKQFLRHYAAYVRTKVLKAWLKKIAANDDESEDYYYKMRFHHRQICRDAHKMDKDIKR